MEMENATILKHSSEISGEDDEGRAIDGHIENNKDAVDSQTEGDQGKQSNCQCERMEDSNERS